MCLFYDKMYADMRASDDDILIGQEQKEKHSCRAYEDGIDEKIIMDKRTRKYFLEK